MRPTGITPNLPLSPDSGDVERAREFYQDYLGFAVEEMNQGWVRRFSAPDGRASVQLVTRDASAPVDSDLSVHVGDDVEAAYAEALRRGYEIVHPLTTEPWGVTAWASEMTCGRRARRRRLGRRHAACASWPAGS